MAATNQGSDVRAEGDALARAHPWDSGLEGSSEQSRLGNLVLDCWKHEEYRIGWSCARCDTGSARRLSELGTLPLWMSAGYPSGTSRLGFEQVSVGVDHGLLGLGRCAASGCK